MSYDIYGNPLMRGHCEVHPHVHEEYPCSVCIQENKNRNSQQQSECDYYKIASLEHGLELSQQRIAELEQRNGELAATVERFVELREHLPNVRQWVIEFEKLVHKTPRQNLNAVKREVAISAALTACRNVADERFDESDFMDFATQYANTKYPSDKDGE